MPLLVRIYLLKVTHASTQSLTLFMYPLTRLKEIQSVLQSMKNVLPVSLLLCSVLLVDGQPVVGTGRVVTACDDDGDGAGADDEHVLPCRCALLPVVALLF